MKFWEAENLVLQIRNLRPGNEVQGDRPVGELVAGDSVIPCILQQRVYGSSKSFESAGPRRRVVVGRHRALKVAPFSRQGYVSIQVLWKDKDYSSQVYVYIRREHHRELLKHFRFIRRSGH